MPEALPAGQMPYRLGLPAWAFPGWRDRYFRSVPSALGSYARVFNAVEGNTTFYRVPGADTVAVWREAVRERDFELCFKLPRTVTHERRPDLDDLRRFLDAVTALEDHLGPLLVQLPARVGPAELPWLARLLEHLPTSLRRVLEVRHPDFFSAPERLEPLLERFGVSRVMLDARAIHQGDREHPEVAEALHEKPDLPVLPAAAAGLAFVRLVLHPDRRDNQRYVDEWAARAAGWIAAGQQVYVMIHCPNNLYCPELALGFHRTLRSLPGAPAMPELAAWPVPQQASLL